jgi:hypothetical protein
MKKDKAKSKRNKHKNKHNARKKEAIMNEMNLLPLARIPSSSTRRGLG